MTAYIGARDFDFGDPFWVESDSNSTPIELSPEGEEIRRQWKAAAEDYYYPVASRLDEENSAIERSSLRQYEAALRVNLALHKARLRKDVYEVIRDRIPVLLDPDDWETSDAWPNMASFNRMLDFLARHREYRAPSLFLNRLGYFDASWRPGKDALVSIIFRPDGYANWLVFVPSEDKADIAEEAAGRIAAESLTQRLKDFNALKIVRRKSVLKRLWERVWKTSSR